MLKEISLKDALLAFADHRDVLVLMDAFDNDPQITKLNNLIGAITMNRYRFLLDDVGPTSVVGEAVVSVEEAVVSVEETPSQLTKKAPESTKSQNLVKQKLRAKTPQVVRKIEPKEEEPFDYGKLGALIRAGRDMSFLQSEFKCTRSQIAARIRIWKKMEEEGNEGKTSDE